MRTSRVALPSIFVLLSRMTCCCQRRHRRPLSPSLTLNTFTLARTLAQMVTASLPNHSATLTTSWCSPFFRVHKTHPALRLLNHPTTGMSLRAGHQSVDETGLVSLPYLQGWSAAHNLVELVGTMSTVFGTQPPVSASRTNTNTIMMVESKGFHRNHA